MRYFVSAVILEENKLHIRLFKLVQHGCLHDVKCKPRIHIKDHRRLFLDPVYTVPDSHSDDIEFGQFEVIFTLATFSMIICY